MTFLRPVARPVAIVASVLMLGETALDQLQLTPQAADSPSKTSKSVKTKPIKPPPPPKAAAKPAPAPNAKADAPAPDDPNADLVYGAYQRGLYKTAFDLAMKRAQENKDPAAMTMLGELYANSLEIGRAH